MAIVRWRDYDSMDETMKDDMMNMFNWFSNFATTRKEETTRSWMPRIDTVENKDNYIIYVEVPGMSKEDIKINVTENSLTISGEKKREEDDENLHYSERSFGKFERSFTLSSQIDVNNIKADYKNGVLNIVLPKKEETKPREIAIKVG